MAMQVVDALLASGLAIRAVESFHKND